MTITNLAQYKRKPIPRFNSLDKWLAWQETLHFTAIELGLDRCRRVANAIGLLPPSYFVISISGTNGKGSCAIMLETILRGAGYNVGLYTSPHLLRYNERIKLYGQEVSDAILCDSFNKIDIARGTTSLTYFEFSTLAAMNIFQNNNVDIAVMEVGMGGRLDAVNMLDADISLISTIDIDHENWLGSDREAIGMEKSGIFRSMRPAVCADPHPPQSVLKTANLVGAKLIRSGLDYKYEISGSDWSWQSSKVCYQKLPIPGDHSYQIQNASGVLMVLQSMAENFQVQREAIDKGMGNFSLPGRFHVVPGEVSFVFDVAHNRQSAATLVANICTLPPARKTILILGMLKDKDHATFMNEFSDCIDNWYVATLDSTRGANADELATKLKTINPDAVVTTFDELLHAFSTALSVVKSGDRIVVTGSFITVGIALKYFKIE